MAFKNRFYPHLLPEDITVWERFLAKFPDMFARFDYDVRVGTGSLPPPTLDANLLKMWSDLSQKRIDAVGHTHAGMTIIEITRRAGMKAVGQLMVYPTLYRQDFHPIVPVTKLLVAEELLPDIEPTLQENGINYILVPEVN